jgi:hypothetical protein
MLRNTQGKVTKHIHAALIYFSIDNNIIDLLYIRE